MNGKPLLVGYQRELVTLLQTLRASCGNPTLRTIAPKAHVSQAWLSEVFRGNRIPSGVAAAAIAKALGATAEEQRRARFYAEKAVEDRQQQTSDRADGQRVSRQGRGKLIRDADARMLGVHAAIVVDDQHGDLPAYVPRDVDSQIRTLLAGAGRKPTFPLLVGESSTGKTRTLFEALLAELPDWWLLEPDDADQLRDLAARPPARTVVWLDELQRLLDGPRRLGAPTVKKLLESGVVLAATIWTDRYNSRNDPSNPDGDEQLLRLAQIVDIAADFSDAERERAHALTEADQRLGEALSVNGPGVAQILSAGPDLQRRWEHATDPCAAAMITAAVDARRLGMEAPLTVAHLRDAVPGDLTPEQRGEADPDWFGQALTYARYKVRRAASVLTPHSSDDMGPPDSYRAADYLLHLSFRTRRTATLPERAWEALAVHADDSEDLRRLANQADARARYQYSARFHAVLADRGDKTAASRLADITAVHSPSEAAAILEPFIDDDPHIAAKVTVLRAGEADIESLRRATAEGDLVAHCQLIGVLATADPDLVRAMASGGDSLARAWLTDHDADPAHLRALRDRADRGDRIARGRLAEAVAGAGDTDGAVALLATAAGAGDHLAAAHRADLLVRLGRTSDLRALAHAGDTAAESADDPHLARGGHLACRIAGALADDGAHDQAIAIMQAHEDGVVELADDYLIELLIFCDRIDLLRHLAATGEWSSNRRLAELADVRDDVDSLRAMENDGNWFATALLVDRMLAGGQVDDAVNHLTARARAGDDIAAGRLPDLLADHGREQELANLARTDPWYASGAWATYLAETGRPDEAEAWFRKQNGPGKDLAASQLAELLVTQGRIEEALDILRPRSIGFDGPAPHTLVNLLHRHGRIDDLRKEVNAGASGALERLLQLLEGRGDIPAEAADQISRRGVSAGWPQDCTAP